MKHHHKQKFRTSMFFLLLALTMLPIILFPLSSVFIHQLRDCPRIENGVIDLEGYDFREKKEHPLDGKWEFYWNKWLVTDNLEAGDPDLMIDVPNQWNWYSIDGERLPEYGYASYRLTLKNAPEDLRLIAGTPNLAASYRVFMDRQLVAASGILSKEPKDQDVTLALAYEWLGERRASEQELIIEVSTTHNGGLYLTPMLMEDWSGYMSTRLRTVMATVALGMLLVTIVGYLYVLSLRDVTLHSVALLILELMVLMRVLLRDELFCILKEFLPFINYHMINSILQITTFFLPVTFLLCARDLAGIYIKPWEVLTISLFELACCLPMFYFLDNGMLMRQYLLCLVSMLPYTAVLYRMYLKVKEGQPYALEVSAGMMLIISSLVVANQYAVGLLYINASLYPIFCFVLAALLKDYIYIHRNYEMRADALEAANLRLELQENETALMLSQIKPHFLYNALIAIQVLCTREPETAETAIIHFAKYLRVNMRSINSREPIPFYQELEHIRNYAAIEKLRFKERLQIHYEIGTDSFSVPPLTIQPLVENAIKHGVCKNIMGGTVILRTYQTPEFHCIEILDDGPGFDPAALEEKDSKSIGLKNISFRLKHLMDAAISIESKPDKGTRVMVQIPREES